MVNLILFVGLFLMVSALIAKFCKSRRVYTGKNCCGILKIDFRAVLTIGIIVLIPALIVGYRSNASGVDTIQYVEAFSDIYGKQYLLYRAAKSFEWLFWGVLYLFKIYGTMRIGFIFFAWITLLVAGLGIYKLSGRTNPFFLTFVFLLLYYQECFNIMRQMPAISLILLAFSFVYERKLTKFIITIIVASLFHVSAFFCLPMYFLYGKKIVTGFDYIKRLICAGGIILLFPIIVKHLLNISVFKRFEIYSKNIAFDSSFIWIKTILLFMPVILILYFQSKKARNCDLYSRQFLMNVTFIYVVILMTRMYTNWIFRLGLYYQLGSVILGAELSKQNTSSKLVVTKNELYLGIYYLIYYFYLNYFNNFKTSALVNLTFDFINR